MADLWAVALHDFGFGLRRRPRACVRARIRLERAGDCRFPGGELASGETGSRGVRPPPRVRRRRSPFRLSVSGFGNSFPERTRLSPEAVSGGYAEALCRRTPKSRDAE